MNLGRKSQKIKKNGFMTLRYGILTLETSDRFLLPEHFEKSSSGGFEDEVSVFRGRMECLAQRNKTILFLFFNFFGYI